MRKTGHRARPRRDSAEPFVHTEIQATPLAAQINEQNYVAVARETRIALEAHEQTDGAVRLPIQGTLHHRT
jgi:sorbitol-specific phosphotransferase system component IIBC